MSKQNPDPGSSHRFCVAPMLEVTDRHARRFYRLLSRRARLYTEMVTTGALLHGDAERHLRHDPAESPVALQLGGSDPAALAECARLAEAAGYDEVNLNCGCPSDRVQAGRFGACLMLEPGLVAESVAAMREATSIPVTVKCRLGVDEQDDYETFLAFIDTVAAAGCDTFIVHARKAWLRGLSPKENREIPPLRHEWVWRLKQERPQLNIIINGGITDLESCEGHLTRVDGVMLGRAVWHHPWLLGRVDSQLFGMPDTFTEPLLAVSDYLPYVERELATGTPLPLLLRPLMGLFHGLPGARRWRRILGEHAHRAGSGVEVLHEALQAVDPQCGRAALTA